MDILKEFLWALKRNRKYQLVLASAIVGVVVLVVVIYLVVRPGRAVETFDFNANTEVVRDDFLSQTELSRYIDGIKVSRGEENLYPVGIMIENLSTTRPQSGLSKANLVYEGLAEGGI